MRVSLWNSKRFYEQFPRNMSDDDLAHELADAQIVLAEAQGAADDAYDEWFQLEGERLRRLRMNREAS